MNVTKKLIELDERYKANMYRGQLDAESLWLFEDRKSRVVVSAPHATQTYINNHIKKSDLYTGALAELLGYQTGCSVIVRQKFVSETALINDFVLRQNPDEHFFLDIHGMRERPFDLAVGTGFMSAGEYLRPLTLIKELAEKHRIKMVINHPDYRGPWGLTGFYQSQFKKPSALQLEWRPEMRNFYHNAENVTTRTLPFLDELVRRLEDFLPVW